MSEQGACKPHFPFSFLCLIEILTHISEVEHLSAALFILALLPHFLTQPHKSHGMEGLTNNPPDEINELFDKQSNPAACLLPFEINPVLLAAPRLGFRNYFFFPETCSVW